MVNRQKYHDKSLSNEGNEKRGIKRPPQTGRDGVGLTSGRGRRRMPRRRRQIDARRAGVGMEAYRRSLAESRVLLTMTDDSMTADF